MKKVTAILLACVLLFALVACGGSTGTTTAPASSAPPSSGGASYAPTPWANPDGSPNLDKVAYYDSNFDYTQTAKHRVIYITESAPDPSSDRIVSGLTQWGKLENVQFDGLVTANGDPDLFLTLIQTQIDQGYDGLVIDPDGLLGQAVADIMNDNPQVAWMTFNMSARAYDSSKPDDPGPLLHPFAGFDFVYNGQQCSNGLLDWKTKNFPDVPWDRVGYIVLQNAEYGVFNLIQSGSDQVIRDSEVPNQNMFVADVAAFNGSMPDAAQQSVASIITQHSSSFDVWIISALIEPYAMGTAVATTTLGVTDKTCIISTSASALIPQWDAGVQTAWRMAWYTEPVIMCEPIMGALVAFMNGWAQPNTIWPSWVNVNDDGGANGPFATIVVPAIYFSMDNYKQYLAWTDVYSGNNDYPEYPKDGITRDTFPSSVPIPDYYHVLASK